MAQHYPLVSVIIRCYRQGHFLREALASLFVQNYPAVEIVLINDGSDDDTHSIGLQYSSRIVYQKQDHLGASAAGNTGIKAARGEYLLFLDADDVLHHRAIAMLIEAINGDRNRLAIMGCKMFTSTPADAGELFPAPADRNHLLPTLFFRNIAPIHCWLTPKELIERAGGFNTAVALCEDWDLWFRVALGGASVAPIEFVGAYYRRHAGSASHNIAAMLSGEVQVLLNAHREIMRRPELFNQWGGESLLESELNRILMLFEENLFSSDLHALLAALRELLRAMRQNSFSGRRSPQLEPKLSKKFCVLGYRSACQAQISAASQCYAIARLLGASHRTVIRGLMAVLPHSFSYLRRQYAQVPPNSGRDGV